ncbi:MAG: sugar-binding domain-containing protein [Anaerolineales bacterium]
MSRTPSNSRDVLLADVAEMYFKDGLTQAEIAREINLTRSMVSRMLSEAREKEIVKIEIVRQFNYDTELQQALTETFNLQGAVVFHSPDVSRKRYLTYLGVVAAQALKPYLEQEDLIVGTAWGTTLGATIEALDVEKSKGVTVVQLVGALGERNLIFDGHQVVHQLADKLGGQGYYLNVPYIVDKPETVESLMTVQGVQETMQQMKECELGLVGIGSTDLDYSTFYNAGYLVLEEMRGLAIHGAVGNVCGLYFDIHGNPTAREFQRRSITIRKRDLVTIPLRIGIAGGEGKTAAILGALRGKYINYLITDSRAASEILHLRKKK